jgi:hypothetical protein
VARLLLSVSISFLLSISLAAHASAQAPAQALSTVDGKAVVARANAAMGCSLVGKDTTFKVVGTLKLADGTTVMPVTIQSQGAHRWRSELDTPKGHKVTIISDGEGQVQHATLAFSTRACRQASALGEPGMGVPACGRAPSRGGRGALRGQGGRTQLRQSC